jgi:hypothetical protein
VPESSIVASSTPKVSDLRERSAFLTLGFSFKSKLKNFKLGPLVVRGAKPEDKDALLEVELTVVR